MREQPSISVFLTYRSWKHNLLVLKNKQVALITQRNNAARILLNQVTLVFCQNIDFSTKPASFILT